MYNEDQKQMFIDEQMKRRSVGDFYFIGIFKRAQKYEEGFGSDLCKFTKSQIELMYNTSSYTSLGSLKVANSVYNIYTKWCFDRGLCDSNQFDAFNEDNLVNYLDNSEIQGQIATREMILRWCEELPNPSDKFLLLGIFEGISGKDYCEFANLTIDDLYSNTNEINVVNRGRIKVSPRLIQYGLESADTTRYYSISRKQKKIGQFKESDLIIKEYASVQAGTDEFWTGRRIYKKCLRIIHFLFGDTHMTAKNISDSGIIDMIRRRSNELCITTKTYMANYNDEIVRQYGRVINANMFIRKYGQYI